MGAPWCLVNYDGRSALEATEGGICSHLLSYSIDKELLRYAEQRQRATEHSSKFRAALRKCRSAGPNSFAHLVDSEVKLEQLDLIDSESDAEEEGLCAQFAPFCQRLDDDADVNSCFKEQLDRELEKPFDPGLLCRLLGLVSERKVLVRHRESRQRTMDVETTHEGLSYLDHHPDFATRLASSSTPQEQLSLLRGFVFWLQRACDPEAFKPWASSSTSPSQDSDCFDCQIIDKPSRY